MEEEKYKMNNQVQDTHKRFCTLVVHVLCLPLVLSSSKWDGLASLCDCDTLVNFRTKDDLGDQESTLRLLGTQHL